MFTVDTHCDTLLALCEGGSEFTGQSAPQVTPERLRTGGVSLQVCALFAGSAGPGGQGKNAPAAMAEAELAMLPRLTEAGIRQVDSPFDVADGEHCLMLSIEGGEIIGDSLETLRRYRALGVRIFSLTWNHENLIACPHTQNGHRRLTPFGWDVVRELARLGIAVDVSHLGEGGFWDLIFNAEKPPMASHSCCRKLCGSTRNLTDDQIRALIERDGWIGINFYTRFLTNEKTATADTIVDHIAHIAELGGIRHVGLGSDFDGIATTPLDVRDPSEIPNIFRAMERRGFSSEEIEGVAGRNFLSYFRQMSQGSV